MSKVIDEYLSPKERDRRNRMQMLANDERQILLERLQKYSFDEGLDDDIAEDLEYRYADQFEDDFIEYIEKGAGDIEGSLSFSLRDELRRAGLDLDKFLSGDDRRFMDYYTVTYSWWTRMWPMSKTLNDFRHDYEDEKAYREEEGKREREGLEKEEREDALRKERKLGLDD